MTFWWEINKQKQSFFSPFSLIFPAAVYRPGRLLGIIFGLSEKQERQMRNLVGHYLSKHLWQLPSTFSRLSFLRVDANPNNAAFSSCLFTRLIYVGLSVSLLIFLFFSFNSSPSRTYANSDISVIRMNIIDRDLPYQH